MSHPALEFRNVSVEYGVESDAPALLPVRLRNEPVVRALSDVTLTVAPHERVALIGESGSGKSSLARVAMGFVAPSSGTVFCAGHEVFSRAGRNPKRLYRSVQMLVQDPTRSLDPQMSVGAQLEEPMRALRGVRSRKARAVEVTTLMYRLGLSPRRREERPAAFSSDERRRLALARAIAARPEVLLLDAPLIGLDMRTRVQVLALLDELAVEFGFALVFITHDLRYLSDIADRVCVLHEGRIVEEFNTGRGHVHGPAPQPVHYAHPYTAALFAMSPRIGHVPVVEEATPARTALRQIDGCAFHPRCPLADDRCRVERPELSPTLYGQAACHHTPSAPDIDIVLLRRPASSSSQSIDPENG